MISNNPPNTLDQLIATNKAFAKLRTYHYRATGCMASDDEVVKWCLTYVKNAMSTKGVKC